MLLWRHDFLPVFVEEIRWSEESSPAEPVLHDIMRGRECWQMTNTAINMHKQISDKQFSAFHFTAITS